jgi:hypothetical protein
MEEGQLKKRISEILWTEYEAELNAILDEAQKEFYDLLNSETETNYGERQRFRELVKKWFGGENE